MQQQLALQFQNAAGKVHNWLNATFATTVAIGDTSTAGTASLPGGASLVVVNGEARFKVNGDAAAWLAAETDTAALADVVVNGYTIAGDDSVQTFT